MALSHRRTVSVEEYFKIDSTSEERYEYVNGYMYMLAGGNPNHAIIGTNVSSILKGSLRGRRCRVYSPDIYFYLSETHYVHPDVTVSCNEQDRIDPDGIRNPCLVIEVLSPGTEAHDRGKKFAWYRACPSIQEYMLVASEYVEIQIYQREKNGLWLLKTFGAQETVELTRLGISFPVAAAYEDTFFQEDFHL
jgi:Uma2 family endonuclease